MDGLLPLQSAGDVRYLLKERHGGAAGAGAARLWFWCNDWTSEFSLERALAASRQQSPEWFNRVIQTTHPSFPVYPNKRIISEPVGRSQAGQFRTLAPQKEVATLRPLQGVLWWNAN
ncbi:hypothetical protein [Bradyrhizobium lablabi]|uniref:hypothetical protein n=1 Tax=Bradyrhizobium lablabi TaxID=722472 RepID=UPI0012E3E5D1|nr:hypothetical protein [Bradyrhizobium lablabi]